MKQSLLNTLGPVTHILAGLIALSWSVSLGWVQPSLGLVLAVVLASLLPDIDTSSSMIGRLFGPIAEIIERRVGHRTLTHSVRFVVIRE